MYYNNNIEAFLKELENFMKEVNHLKKSSINTYLRKIRKMLEEDYSVSDLCGGIDRLIEDHSRGGNKFDERDHGKTKAALSQVRNMIKGNIISSLYISYNKGYCVWERKDEHITEYCITDEKILFSTNTSSKKHICKIGPVNIGKLIYILQESKKEGFLCDQSLDQFQKQPLLTDAPSPNVYEYNIGNYHGVCFGSLLIDGNNPKQKQLQKQYDDLINQIISPYRL